MTREQAIYLAYGLAYALNDAKNEIWLCQGTYGCARAWDGAVKLASDFGFEPPELTNDAKRGIDLL